MSNARQKALDQLASESPASIRLANLLAFFASEPLSTDLFLSNLDEASLGPEPTSTKPQVRKILSALSRHSLLTIKSGRLMVTKAVSIALLERLDDEEKKLWCGAALRVLRGAFPADSDDVENWETCEQLLSHLLTAVDHAEALEDIGADGLWLLDRAALFELSRGRFAEANGLIQRALAGATLPLGDHDPLLGTLHHTNGSILRARGSAEPARREQERALEIHRDSLLPEHPLILEDLNSLAYLQIDLGQADEAESALQRALDARAGLDPGRVDYEAWGALGWARLRQENIQGSLTAYQRALELAEATVGSHHPDTAGLRSGFGLALEESGDTAGARRSLELAAADAEAKLGTQHPQVAIIRSNLAGLLQNIGQLEEAQRQLEMALQSGKETLPKDHPGLWIRHKKLAGVLLGLRKFEEAREHAETALEISKRSLGPSDARVAEDLSLLAEILTALGQSDRALDAYREALDVVVAEFGEDHAQTASYHYALGRSLQGAGDLHLAQDHLSKALSIYEKAKGSDDSATSRARIRLAVIVDASAKQLIGAFRALGRDDEAEQMRQQTAGTFLHLLEDELDRGDATSLQVLSEAAREQSPKIARRALMNAEEKLAGGGDGPATRHSLGIAWHQLARTYLDAGDKDEAIAAFQACERLLAGDPQSQGVTLHELGDVLRLQGKIVDATAAYEKAVERKREAQGSGGSPRDLTLTLLELGRTYLSANRVEDALAALEERLEILTALPEREAQAEGVTLHDLGDVRVAQGKADEAAELYERAAERKREAQDAGGGNGRDLAITLLVLGRTALQLQRVEDAASAHEERLEILTALPEREVQLEGVALHDLGDVRVAQEKVDEAAELYERAAERKREAQDAGGSPRDLAITLLALGRARETLKEPEPALAAYRERLDLLATLDDRDLAGEGVTLHDIGDMLRAEGDMEGAAEAYRRAVDLKHEIAESGEEPPDLGITLRELGRACLATGKTSEALAAFEERLDLLAALPERNAQSEGVTLHDIADVHTRLGDLAKAVELYGHAAERKREAQEAGGSPQDLAITLRQLGRTLVTLDDLDGALAVHRERIQVLTAMPEREALAEGLAFQELGDALRMHGKPEEAAEAYRQALERRQAGSSPRETADTLLGIAAAEREAGKSSAEQSKAAKEAAEFIDPAEDPVRSASAMVLVAQSALADGEPEQALEALEKANRLLETGKAPAFDMIAAEALLGIAHQAAGHKVEATAIRNEIAASLAPALRTGAPEDSLQDLVTLWSLCIDSGSEDFAEAVVEGVRSAALDNPDGRLLLVELLHHVGREREMVAHDYEAAATAYEERLALLAELPDHDPGAEGVTLHDLGDVRRSQGRKEEAIELYERALARKRDSEGTTAVNEAGTLMRLGKAKLEAGDPEAAGRRADEARELLESEPARAAEMQAATLDLRGEAALQAKDPDRAVELFEAAERREEEAGEQAGDAAARRRELLASARKAAAAS